jgi:hypothetical protein
MGEIMDEKVFVGTLRDVSNNHAAEATPESTPLTAGLFSSRSEVRAARRVVRRVRAHATRRFGMFPVRGFAGQLRGQFLAQQMFAGMPPKAVLEAHIEVAANGDLNTLGVFEAVLDRYEGDGAHLSVSQIRREARGFIHGMRPAARREYVVAMLVDPWFPAVFQRVSRELTYPRRVDAFSAACRLRDLAVQHDVYEVLSSVCANSPCRFEELWDVVCAVGDVKRP